MGKLSDLHPAEPMSTISDSGLSGRRQVLGSQCLQTLMRERCQVIAQPCSMPSAFFGRYRLMAIDGTVFNTADTKANAAAGCRAVAINMDPEPIRRCAACCWPSVAAMRSSGWRWIDMMTRRVHGAHCLLEEVGPEMLVMVDAGITEGGFLEHARQRRAHVLAAEDAGTWEHLSPQRRLADGSVLAWVGPTRPGHAQYPVRRGMWVRIISYRVTDERLGEVGKVYRLVTTLLNPQVAPALTLVALYHERWEVELVIDEIKTHERAQRKVLRSKTPEGVRKAALRDLSGPLRRARPGFRKPRWKQRWTPIGSVLRKDSLN